VLSITFDRPRSPRHAIAYLLLALGAVVFILQLRSLYTVPVFDSVRWGGDETWLMREFGNQARHGAMSYPESFGAPQRTDGVLAGSMWIDALIYGATGNSFFPQYDLASIGRTVTSVLALLLLASLYFILRKLRVFPILAAGCVALIVLNQGFVWAVHSARYDLLTGLTLLWLAYLFSRETRFTLAKSFLLGFATIGAIIFSRHMLTLAAPVLLVLLIRNHAWNHVKESLAIIGGLLAAGLLLSLAYWLGAGEFSLFGGGGASGSYSFVLNQIPIMRPFSRNVQMSNLQERINLFLEDAPSVFVLLGIAILLIVVYKAWQWRVSKRGKRLCIATTPSQQFILSCGLACALSWILLQGSRPYYLFHIVPLLVVVGAIVLQLWSEVFDGKWYGENVAALLLTIAITTSAGRAIPQVLLGEAIARDQQSGITSLLARTEQHSRILVDVAGLDIALRDTSRKVLTLDMFQPPPIAGELVNKLEKNRIDYVILRSSPVSTPFEPGRALLPFVLDSTGDMRDSAMGFFYDDGRNYDASLDKLISQGLDTLRLYSVKPPKP